MKTHKQELNVNVNFTALHIRLSKREIKCFLEHAKWEKWAARCFWQDALHALSIILACALKLGETAFGWQLLNFTGNFSLPAISKTCNKSIHRERKVRSIGRIVTILNLGKLIFNKQCRLHYYLIHLKRTFAYKSYISYNKTDRKNSLRNHSNFLSSRLKHLYFNKNNEHFSFHQTILLI